MASETRGWPVSVVSELLSGPGFCFHPSSTSIQRVRFLLRPSQWLGTLNGALILALPHPQCSIQCGQSMCLFSCHFNPGCYLYLGFSPHSSPLCLLSLLSFTEQRQRVILPLSQVRWPFSRKPPLPYLTGFLTAWPVSPVSPQVARAVLEGKSLSLWSVHSSREDEAWHPLHDTELCGAARKELECGETASSHI